MQSSRFCTRPGRADDHLPPPTTRTTLDVGSCFADVFTAITWRVKSSTAIDRPVLSCSAGTEYCTPP